jgi:hypothetical protein
MANQVQRTILVDSQRHAVVHIIIAADGSGDITNEVMIDPNTDFQPATFQPISLAVDQIWWDCSVANGSSFTGRLLFEAPSPFLVWALSQSPGDSHSDFRDFGGIKDKSGIDGTGRLLMSTTGFGDPTGFFSLILSVKKYFKPASQYPMGALGDPADVTLLNVANPPLSNNI